MSNNWELIPNFFIFDKHIFIVYVPVIDKGEYFVTAISDSFGESGESNHVYFTGPTLETTIAPDSVETSRWAESNYDGIAPHWDTTIDATPPYGLTSGYTFTYLNNCSEGKYDDSRYNGRIKFTLSDNMKIQNAQLNWKK